MGALLEKSRISRVVLFLGTIVIGLVVLAAVISIVAIRDREIADWRHQMSSMSQLLAEQTFQTVAGAYVILDSVTQRVRETGVSSQAEFRARFSTRDIHDLLRDRTLGLPQVAVVTIVAANGDNINFSRSYPVPPINLAERDYFKAHLDNPNLGDFISRPVRNKGNGQWTFYISRRLNDGQGNFMGLVLVGMSVDAFTNFYGRVATDLGEGTSIHLYRSDLTLLARWPQRDDVIGSINRTGSSHEVINVQKKNEGVVLSDGPRFSTGEPVLRLTAVRTTARYPLIVSAVATDELFLSSWRHSAWLLTGITTAAAMALLFGLLVVVRNLQHREAAIAETARLKVEAEAQRDLLQIALGERTQAEAALEESERRWRFALEGSGDGIWDWQIADQTIFFSAQWKAMLGYADDEIGNGLDECEKRYHPDDKVRALAALRDYLDGKAAHYACELRIRCKDGSYKWILDRGMIVSRDGRGTPLRMTGTYVDISTRKVVEDEVRIAAVAFASQNGMLITDPKGIILRVNPSFTRLTGYRAEEVIGQRPSLLSSGRQGPLFYQRMWESLKDKGYWQGEIWNKRKNGQIYAEMLSVTAVVTPEGEITHYVGSFTDITEDKEAEAEIHRLAYYDALTRLPNRRLLQDRLGQAIVAAARSGHYGVIFFIDLDNFKALNDTRGHDVGDLLLVEVAQRLRSVVREGDTVARQGGDEFVVLIENLSKEAHDSAAQARQLGDKLRDAMDRPISLNGHHYHCKLSIGVALFHERNTVEELLKHADLALYQAKNAGRNTIRFFDPAMQTALEQRSTLEAELRLALQLGQFLLHYQPQVDAAGRVIGCEALLRWQHPERGLVPPNDFIPLAEDTGLILPIGHWVLETACRLLKTWENESHAAKLEIAVNVSARQFRQGDFVEQVQAILAASSANPARLKLELTESLVLEDVDDTIAKMRTLKLLGVKFSMDDFGTGYSSLSYLAQLPLDQLKIDQSFVRKLPGKRNEETITRAIITMGRGLAMNVIAEGVETEAQRDFLEAYGCHAYQGYLFSRPLPVDDFECFVQRA